MWGSKALETKVIPLPLCVFRAPITWHLSLIPSLVVADNLGAPKKLALSPGLVAAAITIFRPTLLTLRTWQGT